MYKFLPIFLIFTFNYTFCQIIDIDWEKNYGGSSTDTGGEMVISTDSCLILLANSTSTDFDVDLYYGNFDIQIFKIDTSGEIHWNKTFGGTDAEFGQSIINSIDGGYVIAGQTSSSDIDIENNSGGVDCWIFKIDDSGNLLWETTIGGSDFDVVYSICQSVDSGFVFTGKSYSDDGDISIHHGTTDNSDLIVGKVDKFGNLLWIKSLGNWEDDIGFEIKTKNDDFFICGTTNKTDYADFWILKLDSNGNIIWDKTYGGSNYDFGTTVNFISNSSILVTGSIESNDKDVAFHYPGENSDIWVLCLDSLGDIIWQKTIGGTGAEMSFDVLNFSNNNLLITGNTATLNDGDVTGHHGGMFYTDYWLVKIDSNGIIQWQTCFGGDLSDFGTTTLAIDSNSYYSAGYSYSSNGDVTEHYDGAIAGPDIWVAKIFETCNQSTYYLDYDNDNYGDNENYIYSCEPISGYVNQKGDCNDTNPDIYPGAPELLNGLDDDCDQISDEGLAITDIVKNTISIFPNPVNAILSIQSDVTHQITIVNQLGEEILHTDLFIGLNSISVEDFASGVYWVKAEDGGMVVWVKE